MNSLSLAAAVMVLAGAAASADPVSLDGAITRFGAGALGGVRMVVRYAVERPDRTEVDYLLLGAFGRSAGPYPTAIQVLTAHGDPASLADVEGADCTLSRVRIVRRGREVAVVAARRADDPTQAEAGSLSGPGPMAIRVYRRREGGDVGQSAPVFVDDGAPTRTAAMCLAADVQKALDAASRTVFDQRGEAR